MLVPLVSRGIEEDNAASVHAGFLISYNSVRATVIRTMRGQLRAFPDYTVVIAGTFYLKALRAHHDGSALGHSLGGALASIAALSVKSNFPSTAVRLFTYGASHHHRENAFTEGKPNLASLCT
jgi:hypothetical protein